MFQKLNDFGFVLLFPTRLDWLLQKPFREFVHTINCRDCKECWENKKHSVLGSSVGVNILLTWEVKEHRECPAPQQTELLFTKVVSRMAFQMTEYINSWRGWSTTVEEPMRVRSRQLLNLLISELGVHTVPTSSRRELTLWSCGGVQKSKTEHLKTVFFFFL